MLTTCSYDFSYKPGPQSVGDSGAALSPQLTSRSPSWAMARKVRITPMMVMRFSTLSAPEENEGHQKSRTRENSDGFASADPA